MSDEKQSYESTILTLIDESGEEIQFEHLDTVMFGDHHYFALSPLLAAEDYLNADGDLLLMRVDVEDGEEVLVGIDEQDREFEAVWALFEERLAEEYELVDDDQ